jgi:hypothetical protein
MIGLSCRDQNLGLDGYDCNCNEGKAFLRIERLKIEGAKHDTSGNVVGDDFERAGFCWK